MASYRGRNLTVEEGLSSPPIILDAQSDLANYDVQELSPGQLAVEASQNGKIWILNASREWVEWA